MPSRSDYQELLQFLATHLTESQRQAIVSTAFVGHSDLLSQVRYAGSPWEFAHHITEVALRYGDLDGNPALFALLDAIRPNVGINHHATIDGFKTTFAQATQPPPDFTPLSAATLSSPNQTITANNSVATGNITGNQQVQISNTVNASPNNWGLYGIIMLILAVIGLWIAWVGILPQTTRDNILYRIGAIPASATLTYTLTPEVISAADDEILVILARFEQLGGTSREPEEVLERRLNEALAEARRQGVNVRIDPTSEIIETSERARAVAEAFGATLVIWGMVEPAGLDVRYEIVVPKNRQVETTVSGSNFRALASLDEVDIRISNPMDEEYVILFTVGQLLYFDDDYAAALPFFEDAIALVELEDTRRASQLSLDASCFYMAYSLQDETGQTDLRPCLQAAIAAYQAALALLANEPDSGYSIAATQNNLGVAYTTLARIESPRENLALAIARFERALEYRTPEDAPLDYARTQNNLGNAYSDLAQIESPRENLALAIAAYEQALQYFTPPVAPLDYATTQNNLGAAYTTLARIESPRENLALAIAPFEQALEYFTPQVAPLDYAQTQNNLGVTYTALAGIESPHENLALAMDAFQRALQYYTPQATPLDYAGTQNNLGGAYTNLAAIESPRENLALAIAAFEEALEYYTPQAAPLHYARTQTNLGATYSDLVAIESPRENLALAIAAYERALQYYTPQATPLNYAATQNNLGNAYIYLATIESPAENLRAAIAAFERALQYYTPQATPLDYAQTQGNLGVALDLQGNSAEACAAWEEAWRIYTEQNVSERVATLDQAIEQFCGAEETTPSPPVELVSGGVVHVGDNSGEIQAGQVAEWDYIGKASESLVITVEANWDTTLRVWQIVDNASEEITFNDNIAQGNTNSKITLILPADGTYSIGVGSFENRYGGNYTLTLTSDRETP